MLGVEWHFGWPNILKLQLYHYTSQKFYVQKYCHNKLESASAVYLHPPFIAWEVEDIFP